MTATTDWCLCTIPLADRSQCRDTDDERYHAVPYRSATKIALFKRRLREEDEQLDGGIIYTELPIWQIGYPNPSYLRQLGQGHAGRCLCVRPPVCIRVHRTARSTARRRRSRTSSGQSCSASVAAACRAFFRRDRRSFPSRSPSLGRGTVLHARARASTGSQSRLMDAAARDAAHK